MNELKQRIAELCPDVEGQNDFYAVLEALCLMYSQYCSEDGHAFMYAGEIACDVLEYYECLNPDLIGRGETKFPKNYSRPITLAVVLRAIQNSGQWALCGVANNMLVLEKLGVIGEGRFIYWNLTKDRLEEQPPECIAFLKSILGV